MLYCGDHQDSKKRVSELIHQAWVGSSDSGW